MLNIRWIGQSGYLLRDGTAAICIDPYLSDAVNRAAGRPRMVPAPIEPENLQADAVICTHNHLDHLDRDAIPRMQKAMLFCAPRDCQRVLRELGVRRYQPFDEGERVQLGGFTLEAVFADHTVPAVGVLVRHEGNTLYFTGDTYYHPRLKEVQCDCLFVCINGRLGNMGVLDAVRLTKEIKPRLAIPNHYGMFESNTENPKHYTERIEQGKILEFNQTYHITELLGRDDEERNKQSF